MKDKSLSLSGVLNIHIPFVYDYPDFLKGPDRESCQHLKISFKRRRRVSTSTTSDKCSTSPATITDVNDNEDLKEGKRSVEEGENHSLENDEGSVSPELEEAVSVSSGETNADADVGSTLSLPSLDSGIQETNGGGSRMFPFAFQKEDAKGSLGTSRGGIHRVSSVPRSVSAMANFSKSSPLLAPLEADLATTKRSRSVLDSPTMLGSNVAVRSKSMHQLNRKQLSSVDGAEGGEGQEMIHLYILTPQSHFYHWFLNAWITCLIDSTLALEASPPSSPSVMVSDEEMLRLLEELKAELTDSSLSLDEKVQMLQELSSGASKSLKLKKFFWKDASFYGLLLRDLKLNLLSRSLTHTTREDELELVVQILDTLATFLRGTDHLPSKIQALLGDRPDSSWPQLLTLFFLPPELPASLRNTAQRMMTDVRNFLSHEWELLPEEELFKLLAEVINSSVAAIYYVLFTLNLSRRSLLCLSSVLKQCHIDQWVLRGVPQLLAFLNPSRAERLSPEESVLLYQHFVVLKTLLKSVPSLQITLKKQFYEEFIYYTNPSAVSLLVPGEYPIKHQLLTEVRAVREILQRTPRARAGSSGFRNL
ncbi:unnamed protein product [Cyprideis torosa]|uniref:Uncharacterized protein n=1 Tax=Cyprideis torosa TaxID=163714 RepID=A0A7R8W5Z4_9CRUS|nr:unnamed protein product [Cyprideis torosa]CAG0881995.1 unnamed protein product [Cyprideis torosa]